MVDIGAVVAAVTTSLVALAGRYGRAVIDRVSDEGADAAAEATVGLGRRLLRRLLAKDVPNREGIEASVVDLGEHPDDEDFQAAVRAQVKKALAADAGLLSELAGMVKDAGGAAIALGERSVAAQTLSGIVVTGDNTTIQR